MSESRRSGFEAVATCIGTALVRWRAEAGEWRCCGIELPPHGAEDETLAPGPAEPRAAAFAAALADLQRSPASTENLLQQCDWQGLRAFAQMVLWRLALAVPAGRTISYSELALLAGRPGAARAVGSVMARNRFPLLCPCHRVLPAGGGLGAFQAGKAGGVERKRRLLQHEGWSAAA